MRRRRSARAGDRRNPLTAWALRRNPGSLLPAGPTVGELPPGASELQVQFWAAQLQAAVAIFLEPCCPDELHMSEAASLPNASFRRGGAHVYRCCRACRQSIFDDEAAASRRCLTLPDGTLVHNLPAPLLDRDSELTLRLVCHNSRSALAGINPEWRPIWQWCSAIGYCIAPCPSKELRAAIGEVPRCRCGLPVRVGRDEPDHPDGPLTVTRQVIQLAQPMRYVD